MIEPITLEMDEDDIFTLDNLDLQVNNRRKAVRYIREDIDATLEKVRLFGKNRSITSKLLDISTKGALLATSQKFRINTKVVLHLVFNTGMTFAIEGKIIHRVSASKPTYGIEFKRFNTRLGDYLLDTQTDLVFK